MKIKDEIIMNDKDILREAMAERGMTQVKLGEKLGMLQTAVSAGMKRDRISVEMFNRLLNGMGYAVAVIDKKDGHVRWVVDPGK